MNVEPVPSMPRPPFIMRQNWRRLLFVHWTMDVAVVQATLPDGLTVDEWEGRAWLGVVPFAMENVRPRFFPAAPGLSNFLELNVRTYVRDGFGRTGVWFYSLDCPQPLAVWAARWSFGLPYRHARISERRGTDGTTDYQSRRRGSGEEFRFIYRPSAERRPQPAGHGALEHFLVERYRLFTVKNRRLFTGEVEHEPYPLLPASLLDVSGSNSPEGFAFDGRGVAHVTFSPGVDVRVRAPEAVGAAAEGRA